MKIKAVTIDFWNTLFDSSNGIQRNEYRQRALIQEVDKHGLVVKAEEFNKAMRASWEYFDNIWKNDYRTPSPRETVDFFWDYLELPQDEESIENIVKCFAESILIHSPALINGVRETLQELSENYDLAIISDTGFSPGSVLKELMQQENILQYFKVFSFSDETGVSKPHEKAYLTALRALNCGAESAVHIGDIEQTDIVGAKKVGMKAIRYSGSPFEYLSYKISENTIADADIKSWHDIPDAIKNLNSR